MYIPVISSLRELDRAPRTFLFFIVFNVVSWQSIVGPPLILFARSIDMSPAWVGFLIAFMPLSMMLVAFMVPLVSRLGPKRVMFIGWALRNVLVSAVFLIPWVLHAWGMHAAQYVLAGATLAFCLLRAVGAGGWLPWLHEVVPDNQRGKYFSSETAISQVMTVVVMFAQAALLGASATMGQYMLVYAIGVGAGFISLAWMVRVPGGKGSDGPVSVRSSFGSYRSALRDRPFLAFVAIAGMCYAALTLMSASVVLFMRDELAFSPRNVMVVMAVGALCILFTIRYWGNMADRAGSAAAMLLSMFGHSAAAALCLFLAPTGAWAGLLLVAVIALTSLFAAAFNMAANRALLGYMNAAGRIPYTNVWQVTTSLAVGVTPIAAGVMIDHWGLAGFRACFAASLILGLLFGAMCRWIVKEPTELERREFLSAASVEPIEGNIIEFAARRREGTEGPAPLDRTIRPAQ